MKTQLFGSIEVNKLIELDQIPLDHDFLLGNVTKEIIDEHRHWLGDHLVEPGSHRFYMSFHSYVIRTPTLNILVDTCNGNHKPRPSMATYNMLNTPYLERLAEFGLTPDDIDIVMCTHLHTDHVGWNTRLENGRWVPTFKNARYLMSRIDFEVFDEMHRSNPEKPVNRGSFLDSVLPVVEAGLAVFVDPGDVADADLTDTIRFESAIGHSPGNLNIMLSAGGRRACLCGDVFHHPIQIARPDLWNPADYDHPLGEQARRHLLDTYADSDMLLLTGHFPDPSGGHIVSHGDSFRFHFQD
jgi:glyoxylase-like metal-dependent hydrolase (beta-lactamase superfamily II)